MKRIVALDLLRGYLLCVIAIDHLYRFPNLLDFFTGRGQLWVSAAEGFFLISGLLVGYIYGPKILKKPRETFIKIWKRGLFLYLTSVLLTVGFTAWGRFLPAEAIKSGLWMGGDLGEMIRSAATLRYTYGWADFLPFYSVYMMFAPVAVYAVVKKKSWVVILISGLIWLIRGTNQFLAWQVVFFWGLMIGGNLLKIEDWWINLEQKTKKMIFGAAVLITGITMLMSGVWVLGMGHAATGMFDKNSMGIGRLGLAGIWFGTLYMGFRRFEVIIGKISLGFLGKLGKNSLLAYVLEAMVLFPINVLVPGTGVLWHNVLVTVGVLGLVCAGVVIKEELAWGKEEIVNENKFTPAYIEVENREEV